MPILLNARATERVRELSAAAPPRPARAKAAAATVAAAPLAAAVERPPSPMGPPRINIMAERRVVWI